MNTVLFNRCDSKNKTKCVYLSPTTLVLRKKHLQLELYVRKGLGSNEGKNERSIENMSRVMKVFVI